MAMENPQLVSTDFRCFNELHVFFHDCPSCPLPCLSTRVPELPKSIFFKAGLKPVYEWPENLGSFQGNPSCWNGAMNHQEWDFEFCDKICGLFCDAIRLIWTDALSMTRCVTAEKKWCHFQPCNSLNWVESSLKKLLLDSIVISPMFFLGRW